MLSVSRSGYYEWRVRMPSRQQQRHEAISQAARSSHEKSRGIYGYRKVHRDLNENGVTCCRETVRNVLAEQGLRSNIRRKHRYPKTVAHEPVAANVLSRVFTASAPNQKWAGDITYIPTVEGWLYLAVILDIFSRKIVGWAMSHRVDSRLACRALQMALETRRPQIGVLHHSDQGSQYTSDIYLNLLAKNGMECSLSRRGNCWDNAVVESFFGKLKSEWIRFKNYKSRAQAQQDIFIYLEIFYNRQRRHAFLDYMSPEAFEESYHKNIKEAA